MLSVGGLGVAQMVERVAARDRCSQAGAGELGGEIQLLSSEAAYL